jgi:hypothetical protein
MANYWLLLDGANFETMMRPALAESWRRHSFGPCRELAASLLSAAEEYARRYHAGAASALLDQVATGLPWDRATWRCLVGEVLLYSAAEIPELPTSAATLACLLAPEQRGSRAGNRREAPLIDKAHFGSRDLTFGAAIYRPEHAGYSNADDVRLIADFLGPVRPETWTVAELAHFTELAVEDRPEELDFARECFGALQDLFVRASDRGWVVVHEQIA